MDSTWLVLLSLALGLVVGAGFVAILHVAARRGEQAADVVNSGVPDGVDQIIDALGSAGIVVDPSNNVMKASPGAHSLGLVWNDTLVQPELAELVDTVRRSGESISRDLVIPRGPFGDASIHLHARVARLGSRYILLLAEDHTESVRLDEVRRDFIANISHELKTPIGAVGLLAEALQSAADDAEQVRRFGERLSQESQRLARITQDIIELSRLQSSTSLANPTPLAIDDVVVAAVNQNRVAADARAIELAVGGSSRAHVYGVESMLVTAVDNLISNALQHSPERSRVGIGVKVADGAVEIAITDQGEGIPEAELDRIFERFYRVDQARSRSTGGTGLGLAIVKHAVQNHGGEVRVWSQPGRGSTFTIRLPEASTQLPAASANGAVRASIGDTP
ncbi:sensor histidine kinase [Leifsonia sp. Root112D2]|uniref:sensor histidine kinase n=1 Tax=Leifsonia sp. Root112D2 TaxID=1736426 RepID=UPI0006FA2072|nr:ATP-binding protein [Leifsonia sp. Root112D2]KQV07306.1 histidine kinase [Leifsonia sp. Root112D2]